MLNKNWIHKTVILTNFLELPIETFFGQFMVNKTLQTIWWRQVIFQTKRKTNVLKNIL